jgi:hypothetical protein
MKHLSICAAVTAAVLVSTGCQGIRGTQTTRTTTPPAGPVQAATTEPGVIPAGTRFAIRTNQAISTEQPGQTYAAEVAQDIRNQAGDLLVPRGSAAELAVVQATEGGLTGTQTMELGIRSVTVNGRRHVINTLGSEQRGGEGIGANRRTAEMVGGGALLGTVIGAVAGGGAGAAVGAAAGAAGGAAVQVLTRGKEIRVPAETVMTFELSQPWRLEGYQR